MRFFLFKPYVFACKNRIAVELRKSVFNREILAFFVTLTIIYSIYHGSYTLLQQMSAQPHFNLTLASKLLHICLIGFFFLLMFSSCIAALNFFFSSKDIPLLLSAPLHPLQFFSSRVALIATNSGWMFLLMGVPAIIGFLHALQQPLYVYGICIASFIPFIIIPTLLSSVFIVIFISVIPPHKLRDVLILLAFVIVTLILFLSPADETYISTDEAKLNDFISFLEQNPPFDFFGSPVFLTNSIIHGAITANHREMFLASTILLAYTLVLFIVAYGAFRRFYMQGWSAAVAGGPATRVYDSTLKKKLGSMFFAWNPQLRALAGKEWRLFIRDAAQSLQLLLLLTLTFVYLFNFRALRQGSQFTEDTFAWWHVLLSLANISFGTCVISAIATRFVYPSISLEGRAYCILRNAPISFEQLLQNKFKIWFLPIAILSTILLVSGTWAIQAPLAAIMATLIIAVSLSVGIVGLGVGIGAVYAKFDWETPAQVTASFGSLVFMLLALGTIFVSSIPSLFIFILTCVPSFKLLLSRESYLFTLGLSYFMVFALNWVVAKNALHAGAQRLKDLER